MLGKGLWRHGLWRHGLWHHGEWCYSLWCHGFWRRFTRPRFVVLLTVRGLTVFGVTAYRVTVCIITAVFLFGFFRRSKFQRGRKPSKMVDDSEFAFPTMKFVFECPEGSVARMRPGAVRRKMQLVSPLPQGPQAIPSHIFSGICIGFFLPSRFWRM
jgi:hypothetical protein